MRRWVSRLVNFWLIAFVPSLIGWGLVVRANARGPVRFARFWTWCANRLGFPLLLQPVTDPARSWLLHRSGLWSAAGFVVLLVLWCAMLALPLSLLMSWADWFGGRFGPGRATAASYDPYATVPSAATATPAANALYLITIPLALSWHLVRRIARPALIAFAVVWTARFVYLYLTLRWEGYSALRRAVASAENDRRGRFSLIGTHAPFTAYWATNFKLSQRLVKFVDQEPGRYVQVIHHLRSYPYVLKLLAMDAALYGVVAGVAVGLAIGVPKIVGDLKP